MASGGVIVGDDRRHVLSRDWVPDGVDVAVPNMARAYDFLLGGAHNLEPDRIVAQQAEELVPGARTIARINRAFLGRVVRDLVGVGVRQFLDLGSGIPTVGNVHEIAQNTAPECRVLYVDRDPIAVAHTELMLAGNDNAGVLGADMRDMDAILSSAQARRLLRFDEPIALLMVMMVHWLSDEDDPWGLIGQYRDALPSGSYLALSHVTADHSHDRIAGARELIRTSRSIDQLTPRTHAEVAAFFDGFELLEPGVTACARWLPTIYDTLDDELGEGTHVYAGVGRKP
jgi:hypothetical protein